MEYIQALQLLNTDCCLQTVQILFKNVKIFQEILTEEQLKACVDQILEEVEAVIACVADKEMVRDVFDEDEGEAAEVDYVGAVKSNMLWLLMIVFRMQLKTFKGDNETENDL